MIVGTTVFKLDGNPFFSPEFGRGGLSAVFVIDVSHISNSSGVTFQIQHRNSEDTSFGSLSGASDTIVSTDTVRIDATGLKEIIRIEVKFDAGDGSGAATHFLIQSPTWRPY